MPLTPSLLSIRSPPGIRTSFHESASTNYERFELGWDLLASSRILNSHALSFLDPPPKLQSRPEVLIEKLLIVLKLLLANYVAVFI